MSKLNIKRAVDNIRAVTCVYSPIVEVVVNAIEAIESRGNDDGRVLIRVTRSAQLELQGAEPQGALGEIQSLEIEDNGIGFTHEHRDSFDTLYSDQKIREGGKGFGRLICLKYFEDVKVNSVFEDADGKLTRRTFTMGKDKEIIVGERLTAAGESPRTTRITLSNLQNGKLEKKVSTIARNLVERLLPYFITEGYRCPEIHISEQDGNDPICLNDFISNQLAKEIDELSPSEKEFILTSAAGVETFTIRVFRLFSPRNQKSRICLTAHRRDVAGNPLHHYIPEFSDEFYEPAEQGDGRNYIIRAYVFGQYLDRHVSLERGGFEFQTENDLLLGISQADIEREVAQRTKDAVGTDIAVRQNRKRERVQSYVDEKAPWHKTLVSEVDLSSMAYNPSDEEIELRLQREKFSQETRIRTEVARILDATSLSTLETNVADIVQRVSGTSKNDLIHYIALRRNILDLFEKSLRVDPSGNYSSEGIVHDIIFPRKGESDTTQFTNHNLWLLDERLNFTTWVSSDKPLNGGTSERPDLLVYNKRILFRGDNEASNPIIIFEFKKPQRDDFVNPSSDEDPVQQIVRYVNSIREGKYKTPEGRKMLVAENTPFYGYIVCDLTAKVEKWLEKEKDFKPMPDRLGWFHWFGNINLYLECLSWDKVHRDASMRNRIFFQKLGIL